MKALIITADGFEDSELLVPLSRLKEEGVAVDVTSIRRGRIRGKHGHEMDAAKRLEEIRPDEYDLLILPGGKAPPRRSARKRQRSRSRAPSWPRTSPSPRSATGRRYS